MPSSETARDGRSVALLTGGDDPPYVFGLTKALEAEQVAVDMIGSDDLDFKEFRNSEYVRFLNLRGSQRTDVGAVKKLARVFRYYTRLIGYAVTARPKIFHILWNNKFEYFDRTLLMIWYRMCGRRIVFTAHNVNKRKRDKNDSWMNRATLRAQYSLCDHIFIHTDKMRAELRGDFGVPDRKISVIPFGINNAVPVTALTSAEARRKLGFEGKEKLILFFGRIKHYKGLDLLVDAFEGMKGKDRDLRLVVAGRAHESEAYWTELLERMTPSVKSGAIRLEARFIPDEDTEIYFKAADVLVLPYREIFQSGVMFLSHSFGLPVLAADVGSLTDEIEENRTGFAFEPESAAALAACIERYFSSELYANLDARRDDIRQLANEKHSWSEVSRRTLAVYDELAPRNARASQGGQVTAAKKIG